MNKIIPFENLNTCDLQVDAVYEGGNSNNVTDDPISRLLGGGNQGGIRYEKDKVNGTKFIVLYSTLADLNWPDCIDLFTGMVTYFGDNKTSGKNLQETRGNRLFEEVFDNLHSNNRKKIPPIFLFTKATSRRDVVFRGLCVPGAEGLTSSDDLVSSWKADNISRFQNYKATFTILDIPVIKREWIKDIINSNSFSQDCPLLWKKWIELGKYSPLRSEPIVLHRTQQQQLPTTLIDQEMVSTIYSYFKDDPYSFEKCAAEIVMLMDKNISSIDLTRPWRDGGRDGLGKYKVGLNQSSIEVDFSLEAKCYALDNSVGVKETSRLLSRIRHRQFGILVTTSFLNLQAYKEIIEDNNPILIISAVDIVQILKNKGYKDSKDVKSWLVTKFPKSESDISNSSIPNNI